MKLRDVSLFWKLLVPFAALMLIVGTAGTFLVVRDVNERARTALTQDLQEVSLEARAFLQHHELYLLDSANLAANLQGMAALVERGHADAAAQLLRGVVALKSDLDLAVVTPPDGTGLVEFESDDRVDRRRSWAEHAPVAAALAERTATKHAGLVDVDGDTLLVIAAPICAGADPCDPVGAAVVGLRVDDVASSTATRTEADDPPVLALYDLEGRLLAASGAVASTRVDVRPSRDDLVRRTETVEGAEAHAIYAPFEFGGRRIGIVGVSLPADATTASVRGVALRFALIILAALAGILGIGALISRQILRQVRPLVETNRELASGNLSARAPVLASDEIGEVADGLNKMAEQLQASYETLESRVEQRTEEVERLLRERTEFFASLSHELRTPIALIISHAEMLLDPEARGRTAEERAEVIKESGQQLLLVVNDILDLARLEAGTVRTELEDVSVQQLVDAVRPTLDGLAAAARLKVTIDVPIDIPDVRADPVRLREVLLNLVDNAVKYTPAGGRVTIAARRSGTQVELRVSDTGVGIPKADLQQIFEPFYRVRSTHTQRGEFASGLGLSIAKRLVDAQGGEIAVRSAPGKGTTFCVRLPRSTRGTSARPARGGAARRSAPGRAS